MNAREAVFNSIHALGPTSVPESATLNDLHLDSLDQVELLMDLEDTLEIDNLGGEGFTFTGETTVAQIITLVKEAIDGNNYQS